MASNHNSYDALSKGRTKFVQTDSLVFADIPEEL